MHFSKELLRQLGPEYEHLSPDYKHEPRPRPRQRRMKYEHLSPDYKYEPGSWFLIWDTDMLRKSSRRPFSNQNKKHPVVLARVGPDMTLYPRTTKRGRYRHSAHRHGPDERSCRINKDGYVVLGVPVTVENLLLNETSFSCIEPDGTGLREAIEARLS